MGSNLRDYARARSGQILSEMITSSSGGWDKAYIYLGNQLVAVYTGGSSGTTYFIHQDHLGSTRAVTAMDGTKYDWMDFLPYGEQIEGDTSTTMKFAGYQRDAEDGTASGTDYAMARQFAFSQGRFMSPDLYHGYISTPQTLNRYSYVWGSPCSYVDPLGLCTLSVNSTTALSQDTKDAISTIFGDAGVGVSFATGQADADLQVQNNTSLPNSVLAYHPDGTNVAEIDSTQIANIGANVPSLTMTNDQEVQHATGVLISHELGHALLSPLHNPSGGIMHTGLGLSGLDIFHNDVTGNQRFTPQEASVIQSDCNFKHPPVSGKSGGGSGVPGQAFWFWFVSWFTQFSGVPPKGLQ
jgi:RHS repeat-associated protein